MDKEDEIKILLEKFRIAAEIQDRYNNLFWTRTTVFFGAISALFAAYGLIATEILKQLILKAGSPLPLEVIPLILMLIIFGGVGAYLSWLWKEIHKRATFLQNYYRFRAGVIEKSIGIKPEIFGYIYEIAVEREAFTQNGAVMTILPAAEETDNHFQGQPIYGIVAGLTGENGTMIAQTTPAQAQEGGDEQQQQQGGNAASTIVATPFDTFTGNGVITATIQEQGGQQQGGGGNQTAGGGGNQTAGGGGNMTAAGANITAVPPSQISPASGTIFDHFPRTTTLEWTPDPLAASYKIEFDCMDCDLQNEWSSEVTGQPWDIQSEIRDTEYTFDWIGAQAGRWRVWAVDSNGEEGPKSDWWQFSYTQ